jgi:hypothetical protein
MCSCENEGLSQRERVAYRVRWWAALQVRPYAILRRCALGAPAQIFPIFRSKTVRRSCAASKKRIPISVAVRAIAWHVRTPLSKHLDDHQQLGFWDSYEGSSDKR